MDLDTSNRAESHDRHLGTFLTVLVAIAWALAIVGQLIGIGKMQELKSDIDAKVNSCD